ncbi:hypothetical protein [Streptomyces niveus]|uniref:hypothetical protein n=1 Tax=Streptomyces niveus TaxID=193462 RepID=UPI0035DC9253
MRVPVRATVCVAVSASVALVACGPEKEKEFTGAEPSEASATAAARFAPLVRLHEKESLMPMDATQFIKRSVLRYDHDGGFCRDEPPVADPVDPLRLGLRAKGNGYRHADVELGKSPSASVSCPEHRDEKRTTPPVDADEGSATPSKDPDNRRATTDEEARFFLDPPDGVRNEEGTGAPVYWEYHKHKTDPARTAYVYWFFYPYNRLSAVGNKHEGDWERVAVQLRDGKPQAVTFAKHGSDPCSTKWSELNPRDGHPTVYSALGSHASYPSAGVHSVDRASEKGREWRTWENVRPVDGEPWSGYAGWWGAQPHVKGHNGPRGPYPKRLLPGIFTDKTCGGADKPPADPPADPPAEQPAPDSPKTKDGAIKRYEEFLHAVGREDIDTVCEVAGPAAKQAEDQGFGPCESTFVITFQMIPPEKKKALQTATVDPGGVSETAPDKFEIPAEAVRASVTFSESEIGSSTMGYLKDEWYVVD